MSDFKFIGVVKKKDLPNPLKKDLSDLFLRFEGISHGAALHITVEKRSLIKAIREQFYKKFTKSRVQVITKTNKAAGNVDVYILRKDLKSAL